MIFSNKTYDIIKWISVVFLDALSVFILQLGQEWGFPYYQEIANTLHYVGLFMGALVGVSYIQYNKASGSIPMPDDETEVDNNEVGEG